MLMQVLKKSTSKKMWKMWKHDTDEFAGYLHYRLKYNSMKVF